MSFKQFAAFGDGRPVKLFKQLSVCSLSSVHLF